MRCLAGSVLNRAIGLSICSATMMIVLGVAAVALPGATGIGVAILVASMVIFGGLFHLLYAFADETVGQALWRVLVGIVYFAVGAYLGVHPTLSLVSVTRLVAALFVAEAVLGVVAVVQDRSVRGSGWMLLDATVTLLLGVVILAGWPRDSAWAVGTIAGVNLLVSGFTRVMLSLSARQALHAFAAN
jgi:uncharacterized membrane protein HdeD (DUF308 family)